MMDIKPVPPQGLAAWLQSRGWSDRGQNTEPRLYIFSNLKFGRSQIVFSGSSDMEEYSESVFDAMWKASELSRVPIPKLCDEIDEMNSDVIEFKVYPEGKLRGVPLEYATIAMKGAHDLLMSSAENVIHPKIYYAQPFNAAKELLSQVQFRHTHEGSFVLRVSCPLDAVTSADGPITQSDLFAVPEPVFARKTTQRLSKGLNLLDGIINRPNIVDSFIERLKEERSPQISSNFCAAIASFGSETMGHDSIDVRIKWALTIKSPLGKASTYTKIPPSFFPVANAIAEELRPKEIARTAIFMGTVEGLVGEMDENVGRRSGPVILSLLQHEGPSVRARTELDADHYQMAIEAHRNPNIFVRVKGTLQPGRQPKDLIGITQFELIRQ